MCKTSWAVLHSAVVSERAHALPSWMDAWRALHAPCSMEWKATGGSNADAKAMPMAHARHVHVHACRRWRWTHAALRCMHMHTRLRGTASRYGHQMSGKWNMRRPVKSDLGHPNGPSRLLHRHRCQMAKQTEHTHALSHTRTRSHTSKVPLQSIEEGQITLPRTSQPCQAWDSLGWPVRTLLLLAGSHPPLRSATPRHAALDHHERVMHAGGGGGRGRGANR